MRRQLLAATLCLAALSACGVDSAAQAEPSATAITQTSATSASTSPALAPPVITRVVETAPAGAAELAITATGDTAEALQFAAPLLGGGSLDFTQYAGRTVALWFWAPT